MSNVAKIIIEQIGGKALFMLGAKNLLNHGEENALSFRIRGSKKVNYIKISLTPSDLYNMEFGKIWGHNYKVVREVNEVYVDMLHSLIEDTTGLYTSL